MNYLLFIAFFLYQIESLVAFQNTQYYNVRFVYVQVDVVAGISSSVTVEAGGKRFHTDATRLGTSNLKDDTCKDLGEWAFDIWENSSRKFEANLWWNNQRYWCELVGGPNADYSGLDLEHFAGNYITSDYICEMTLVTTTPVCIRSW